MKRAAALPSATPSAKILCMRSSGANSLPFVRGMRIGVRNEVENGVTQAVQKGRVSRHRHHLARSNRRAAGANGPEQGIELGNWDGQGVRPGEIRSEQVDLRPGSLHDQHPIGDHIAGSEEVFPGRAGYEEGDHSIHGVKRDSEASTLAGFGLALKA